MRKSIATVSLSGMLPEKLEAAAALAAPAHWTKRHAGPG